MTEKQREYYTIKFPVVMYREDDDFPQDGIVTRAGRTTFGVSNPNEPSMGVKKDAADVFWFDKTLYHQIEAAYEADDKAELLILWAQAEPYDGGVSQVVEHPFVDEE